MVRQHFCLVAVAGLGLALLPAPALAAVGGPTGRLEVKLVLAGVSAAGASAKGSKTQTCQAGTRERKTKSRSALIGDTHKAAVVACEQPPKSEPLLPTTLERPVSVALSTVG